MNTNIIDYPDSSYSEVIINKTTRDFMFNKLCNQYDVNFTTPLGKIIGIEPKAIRNFLNGGFVKVHTIQRLKEAGNFSDELVRNSIVWIDRIENPSLPINFDCKEGARLDAGIYNEGRIRERCVEYHNKDRDALKIMLNCSKSILGKMFNPTISIDKRNGTSCIYFPPIFVRHYVKLGIAEKAKKYMKTGVPDYIMKNQEYQRIWLQGTLTEEASLHPCVSRRKSGYCITPRIQLNRNISADFNIDYNKKVLFRNEITKTILQKLDKNLNKLINDEAKMLKNFEINVKPRFSKLHIANNGTKSATYSIMLSNSNQCERWLENIGFELKRQEKQMKLLLNNSGFQMSKASLQEVLINFYSLFPLYLRTRKKIYINKWLQEDQKKELLGDYYDN
ncbi:MAG: hypothetical protein KJ906_02060 [Nanoarchaeota archaeon]|nr:hypothetical protein [Nanoarchaeota archaeon]